MESGKYDEFLKEIESSRQLALFLPFPDGLLSVSGKGRTFAKACFSHQ